MIVSLTVDLSDEAIAQIAQQVAAILAKTSATPAMSRWLTVDQAAEHIGASRQRIYDLRSSGKLRRHGDGSRALIDRRELDRLVEGGV